MTQSTKNSFPFLSRGAETMRGVPEQDMRTCTHHSISLGSRSFRSSCTSCRQRSWYSGCFARLYRTQERPLAVVSWPERQPDRLGSLGLFSTRGRTASFVKPSGRMGKMGWDGVVQGPPAKSLGLDRLLPPAVPHWDAYPQT